MFFRRFVIFFSLLAYTNFLGLIDAETTSIIIPLKDYALISVLIYIFKQKTLIQINSLKILKNISLILGLVILVILSMPFRGEISLLESFKFGRVFLCLLFSFVIYDEIVVTKSTEFISRLVLYLAVYYSILVFSNIIFPSILQKVFVGGETMVTENSWDLDSSRYVVKGNAGILFIHLGFILSVFRYINNRNKSDVKYLIIFFLGMLLQGWRAPMIAVILATVFIYLSQNTLSRGLYLIPIVGFLYILSYTVNLVSEQNIIFSKFVSAYNELFGNYTGSFDERLERSQMYQIPMFLKSKWIGYGFVHKNSVLASNLGNMGDGVFSLYCFDFGYITLLNMFGIVGAFLFLLATLKILFICWKAYKRNIRQESYPLLIVFTISLLISNYSFGGLTSAVGLLPFSIALGYAQGDIILNKQ